MSIRDWFRPKTIEKIIHVHDADRQARTVDYTPGKTKYGNIQYRQTGEADYDQLRENGRGVYNDSLIARGIVSRLIDNVINKGLTLESSPLWRQIPEVKDWDEERQQEWTSDIEDRFKLYATSKESDHRGRMTLNQLQRLAYKLFIVEGECFAIFRYLNSPDRTSTLAIQFLNNDQIQTPLGTAAEAAEARGGKIVDGIEYDASGKMLAIWTREDLEDWSKEPVRVPVWGPKEKRRFVVHFGNFEAAAGTRGFPELAAFVYELDRLTEFDIAELEATLASAIWMGVVETAAGSVGRANILEAGGGNKIDNDGNGPKEGVDLVEIGGKALLMNNLAPGQTFKGFQSNRPNSNFAAFEEVFESRMAGALGMPLSVYRLKFQASYSAARAEILFFWNAITRRRDDFVAGFLSPVYEAWLSEQIRSREIDAPGFNARKLARLAWLYGSWNGISRPVVDPVKEAKAVGMRIKMGHSTGEREAKAYNGSDFSENVRRLRIENEDLAWTAEPLEDDEEEDNETDNP